MPEYGVSVRERRPASHSTNKGRSEQMGFGISGEEFTIPPTIIETSSLPSAFERISSRLSWQEAKLGNNCVFFELGEENPTESEGPIGTIFNGSNWQEGGKAFLESSPQQPNVKSPKFDAVVIYASNFSKNYDRLSTLLKKTRLRMGYNKPVYISVARKEDLDIEQLKHELSKMIQDAHFIMPHILVGRKGNDEDILFETRTKVRRHNALPNFLNKDVEVDETEREAARLREKTPAEILRASFIKAKFKPDTPIPNGEKCFHCKGPLAFMSHAKPNPDGDGFVQVMYRWCLADGKRGQEISLKKS